MSSFFDKILTIDVETSGFTPGKDITRNHQIVAIGLVVATGDFESVDSLYVEIKPNGTSHWDWKAEQIHGLSRDYLNENGVDEEEAVVLIMEFIMKYWDVTSEAIICLGHNVRMFDIPFLEKLLNKYEVELRIAFRTLDTFSAGYTLLGTVDSDELFNSLGYTRKGKHNALDDAKIALGVCRKLRKLMNSVING